MTPARARAVALQAALETRTGAERAAQIIERAKEYETYIGAGVETAKAPIPSLTRQADQETAGAAARRK